MFVRLLLGVWISCFFAGSVAAREQIRVVGSSTVYPFVTVIAEEFGNRSTFRTPIIESTGTGGGFKLFCSGLGNDTPDFVNASRAIKQGEIEECAKHGVTDIIPIKLGYDGIVVANSVANQRLNLNKRTLFLALAKKIPRDGVLVDNFYSYWNEIDETLPKMSIKIYGPPPTSGTRDAFVELVMDEICSEFSEFAETYPDKESQQKACRLIREDGHYVDAGENDNLIIQKLVNDPESLGVFGFSFLEENADKVQGSKINGIEPSFDYISDGSYTISRPLYIYMKGQHIGSIAGMAEFARMVISDDALGEEGLLAFKGLIPMKKTELAELKESLSHILQRSK